MIQAFRALDPRITSDLLGSTAHILELQSQDQNPFIGKPSMIRIENLSKSYGLKTILRSQSFHFPEGEKIALTGSNGLEKQPFSGFSVDRIC